MTGGRTLFGFIPAAIASLLVHTVSASGLLDGFCL